MQECKKLLESKLSVLHEMWDENEALIGEYRENMGAGYHSRLTGTVHETNKSAEYAAAILHIGDEAHYERASRVFRRLAELQDTEKGSNTFGLWSYYAEESLSDMAAPDYNFADFIGKHFIYALSVHSECFDDNTLEIMRSALRNAVECSIKRNVSPDYSNISMMSIMTIISAGELLDDRRIFEIGKARLQKAYEYNMYCGAFSEYNSSTYTPLLIAELTRMLQFFRDGECRQMASKLHDMAWLTLSLYYNAAAGELSPPQKRAYRDIDDGQLRAFIHIGTNGRYGSFDGADKLVLSFLTLPFECPEKYIKNFSCRESRFTEKTYYKQNNIRTSDEDTVIVRNLKSPDLKAYTYMKGEYSMGAFDKSDLWNQRRTCAVVWKTGEHIRSFRLRGINGNYDFCSAVSAADMYKNVLVSAVGFVQDHGNFHYILDKKKSKEIKTNRLSFEFRLSGDSDDVKIARSGNTFTISDENITIYLAILEWIFDGEKAEIRFDEQEKLIELVGYEGAEKNIDLGNIRESYALFTMSVGEKLEGAKAEIKDNIASVTLEGKKRISARIPAKPGLYDDFINL